MSTKSILRTAGRWLAVGAGVAVASYVTYVGYAWMRYGDARPATRPEEQDPLLDRFMPTFEIVERHHIRIHAPADITFDAATEMNLQQSPIIRAIFRGRDWIMRSHPVRQAESGSFIDQMSGIGWGVLAETPAQRRSPGARVVATMAMTCSPAKNDRRRTTSRSEFTRKNRLTCREPR